MANNWSQKPILGRELPHPLPWNNKIKTQSQSKRVCIPLASDLVIALCDKAKGEEAFSGSETSLITDS